MASSSTRKVLLISVGGSPDPVARSIDHHAPEAVVFFASKDSRAQIETEVRPLCGHRWQDQEIITTDNPQDLMRCMEILAKELPRRLDDLGVAADDLIVDFTGGTKVMSAALVLATIHRPVAYSYVGGAVRGRGGLGTVQGGSEFIVDSPNPWDVLAIDLRRRVAREFNQARFDVARDTAAEAAAHVSPAGRDYYKALRDLCEGYLRWSRFEYGRVAGLLAGGRNRLTGLSQAAGDAAFLDFLKQVEADEARLSSVVRAFHPLQRGENVDPADVRALVVDLVANAVRTARLAGRPDDGVARLYSALEKLAKAELAAHGIDNGKARPEDIPESLRQEFEVRYRDTESGTLRFGLSASYQVLALLENPVGLRYEARRAELERRLQVRNTSFMAHGWGPIKEEVFDSLLALTLDFLGIGEADLPALPRLPFD